MASPQQVRAYLAHWFQLGKPVVFESPQSACSPPVQTTSAQVGSPTWLPAPIFSQGHYSSPFEACWQQILATGGEGCHLLGTDQTIAELLSPQWDIEPCARCTLPIPLPVRQVASPLCPCSDLPQWPNSDIPAPRAAVDSTAQLGILRDRLGAGDSEDRSRLHTLFHRSADLYPTAAVVPESVPESVPDANTPAPEGRCP